MKRYASHFVILSGQDYLKQHVVELENGYVVNVFPLTEELEDIEWLPGAIYLTKAEGGLTATYVPDFDITTMQPVAGTRRKQLL
nr:hypothetical protein [uncultured Bacteroides sp.]